MRQIQKTPSQLVLSPLANVESSYSASMVCTKRDKTFRVHRKAINISRESTEGGGQSDVGQRRGTGE